MGKKALLYGTGMICLYLAVAYATGFSNDLKASTSGATSVIKAFQGRS